MSRCISSSEAPLDRRSQWPTPRSRFLRAWTISRLNHWQIRLVICLARSRALQATQDLEYLHLESICHGDLNYSNVLFQLTNFDSWSKHELQAQRGNPRLSHINCGPGRPRYLVDSPSFFAAEPRLLTKNTSIADHSESISVESALLMNSAHLTITLP